jgi:molybdopterin-containing oxidoreductase family membrane subunit
MTVSETLRPAAEPADTGDSKVNRDILRVMEGVSLGYFGLLAIVVLVVAWAGSLWVLQVYQGLGLAGYSVPIFWGVYIVTFVFWIGIAHAGTLISAILYLFRAKWRNAINRSAEAMTVFAVLTAAQFLGIHVGRLVGHLRDLDLRDHLDRVPLRGPDP